MKELLEPIRADSLKDVFIANFECLILSGKLAVGEKLPSERELAVQLGVSRPVVHEGLMDLAFKGLVSMKPRVGTVVNDFRKEGSLAVLESMLHYHNGKIEPKLLRSTLEMRSLIEMETTRLAARRRTKEHIKAFEEILKAEGAAAPADRARITELDFEFHHLIAMASGNVIYPLFLNTFRQFYTSLSGQFFSTPAVVPVVLEYHREIFGAMKKKDEAGACAAMRSLLAHGERYLKKVIE